MGYFFRGFAWTWGKIFAIVTAHFALFVVIMLAVLVAAVIDSWKRKKGKK